MLTYWLLNSICVLIAADQPTGSRITPPTLSSVSPVGVARGTTVEITMEGLNLAKASAIYFSEPGITGRIVRVKELPDLPDIRLGSNGTASTVDVGPLPPRNQVTVEVDVSPDAEIGPGSCRLLTALGDQPGRQVSDRALLRRGSRQGAERYAGERLRDFSSGGSGGCDFSPRRYRLLQNSSESR
jgi:hypothetical protein